MPRKGYILIQPEKKNMVNTLQVYITFPRPFWLEEDTIPAKQPFTGFTQWLSPAYAPDTNPHRWYQESVDMSTLPGACAHPTLLFYIYGDQSTALAKELAARSSQSEKDVHIISFFKPYYSLLPHFVQGSADCTPISCVATSWGTDEFAGYGSYSTFRTGLKEGDKDIEIMREGLPGRSLWFAGEHNGPFIAMGTATSAYVSCAYKRVLGVLANNLIFSGVVRLLVKESRLHME